MTDGIIKTVEELREIYAPPSDLATDKVISSLDEHCRDFIGASPFVILSSCNAKGYTDGSPRGGEPGFVSVLDNEHLVMADYRGNNRLDSLTNIIEQPKVSLLFLIPGVAETLRINAEAKISISEELRNSVLNKFGKAPPVVLLFDIKEIYLHCAISLKTAKIWKPETWPAERPILNANKIWAAHGKTPK